MYHVALLLQCERVAVLASVVEDSTARPLLRGSPWYDTHGTGDVSPHIVQPCGLILCFLCVWVNYCCVR